MSTQGGGGFAPSNSPRQELTFRAVLTGALLGAVLAIANVYMGLKTGLGDQGNLASALATFAIFRVLQRLGAPKLSILETNISQTTALSAATMSFTSGAISAFPALSEGPTSASPWSIGLWSLGVGGLGLLLALPLRRLLIERDRLAFPSGVATAELISALHQRQDSASRSGRWLFGAAAVSSLVVVFRDGLGLLPSLLSFPFAIRSIPLGALTVGVSLSPMMLGLGALIGVRLALSLLVGSAIAWIGLAPVLVLREWVQAPSFEALAPWLLWPGAGLMVGSGLAQLALEVPRASGAWRDLKLLHSAGTTENLKNRRFTWLVALVGTGLMLIAVGMSAFEIPPGLLLAGVFLSLFLAWLCARVVGETDFAPGTQMGQLAQVSLGSSAQTSSANVLAGALATGVSMHTAAGLWAFRTGDALKATVRHQAVALVVGLATGAVTVSVVYGLLAGQGAIGTESFPAPASLPVKAIASLTSQRGAALPSGALEAFIIAALLGAALTLAPRMRFLRFVPSPYAVGMGLLIPAHYVLPIVLGAAATAWSAGRFSHRSEEAIPGLATGVIAGESLTGLFMLIASSR